MRPVVVSFLLFAVVACERPIPAPIGVKEWSQVLALADAFILKGDVDAIRTHVDLSGLPSEELSAIQEALKEWKGASPKLQHVSTAVMTPGEFDALTVKEHREFAGDMPSSLPPPRWNFPPAKLIVFTFVSKDPADKTTKVRWFAGVFQKGGLWYFASRRP